MTPIFGRSITRRLRRVFLGQSINLPDIGVFCDQRPYSAQRAERRQSKAAVTFGDTVNHEGERKKPGEIYVRTARLGSGYSEIAKAPSMSQVVDGGGYGTGHSYLIDLT